MADFTIYSRRWGHDDTYTVERTATGWHVHHISIKGDCDKQGKPVLYENFEQDSICYPHQLPDLMETLWEYAQENNLTDAQIQPHLDELAKWVQVCEKSRPGGIFNR